MNPERETIVMVIVTVALAVVLYFMVSGLIG